MFYLCVYIWMSQNGEREAGCGRGHEYRWFLCMLGWGETCWGRSRGCHSDVHHVFSQWERRDKASDSWWQRQLVVLQAPVCDPLRGDTSTREKKGKKSSRTNQNSRPDTVSCANGTPMPWGRWHIRQYFLSQHSSFPCFFHPPVPEWSPITYRALGSQLNQVTFLLFHFFCPKFEYEKGLS